MGDKTRIEWTDASWNPLAAFDRETGRRGWFCTRVSDGCKHCYAATLNQRLGTGHDYQLRNLEKIEFRLVNLDQPLRWRRPRRIFVNSMTDLFHESVPDEMIDRVFAVMALAPHHVFQVLTKRPERMAKYCTDTSQARRDGRGTAVIEIGGVTDGLPWPLPNVWVGTSVENQRAADERIPHLLRTPAAVRFLSCEPLLGPVELARVHCGDVADQAAYVDALTGLVWSDAIGGASFDCWGRVHWVIVGGESGGRHARPIHPVWVRSLRDQCQKAGVAFFFKQWGSWVLGPEGFEYRGAAPKSGGRLLDGREWNEYPEVHHGR
jgi:protein gp37